MTNPLNKINEPPGQAWGLNDDIGRFFMVGYMVTWTTYGTWLQGDKRGYVKHGQVLEPNKNLEISNQELQKYSIIVLNHIQRETITNSIIKEGLKIGQIIEAIAVRSNHVHIAARPCRESIEQIVSRYKNISRMSLNHNERIWTRGFDKRFYFTEENFQRAIDYVKNQ